MTIARTRSTRLRLLVCGIVWSLWAMGCGKAQDATSPIELILQNAATSYQVGPATIRFSLIDTNTKEPVTHAEIRVEGNMTHPGMATSHAEAIEVAPGDYEASLVFTMRGDWYLFFEIRLPDGQTLTRQVRVAGVTE